MSVYDTIREGIQEDWRKANHYNTMKAELEARLNHALSNPDHDAWLNGFHTGYEAYRRLMRNEYPLNETDEWNKFRDIRNNSTKT